MPTGRARKTADPRDKDKMIRQLSLVAYLMSAGGRKVDAATIRWNVEGYGDYEQQFDAFTRRFFADRDELRSIGIDILSERGDSEGDVYWLPRENFFLPELNFSAAELAALHTCLHLLGGQFAYSRMLRLALQGLALGSGNRLEDPASGRMAVNLLSSGYDSEVAARLSRIEAAIAKRKTILFDYYAMGKDATGERRVDPYGLTVSRGDWYLIGYAREREAVRVFKLKRIKGRIRYAGKSEHDFTVPEDFDLGGYLDLEPWQLGAPRGTAVIRFSELMGWWATGNLSHCGEVTRHEDGSATFTTDYAGGAELCSLVLGFGEDATLEAPDELRALLADSLETVAALHEGPAPQPEEHRAKPPADEPAARLEGEAPQVQPEHFAQLTRTITYLLDKLGATESVRLDVAAVCADLGLERAAFEKDIELLRLVNTGGGGYLIEAYVDGDELRVSGWPEGELMRQPARLTPREARAMLLAIDLVGSQVMAGYFPSLGSAREKIIAAAGGPERLDPIPVAATGGEDYSVCRAINRGLNESLLVEIEYLSRENGRITRRVVEPCLINRTKGRWYLLAYCRERGALRTFRFEMIKSARLLDERFTPRDIDLAPFLADPRFPSGNEDARSAVVRFSPEVSRWVRETEPGTTQLADGGLLSVIPYFSERWLSEEVLKYRGEARIITPDTARDHVAALARRLRERYR